jgi:hypothetical protein
VSVQVISDKFHVLNGFHNVLGVCDIHHGLYIYCDVRDGSEGYDVNIQDGLDDRVVNMMSITVGP